ncbi:MAG: DUF1772 domain-containing protein [Candidatus Binatia bacterium]
MSSIQLLTQFLTLLSCALFAGAAVYVTLVEHPARMECGTAIAVTEFAPSYRRAAIMQASLAALGLVCAIITWWASENLCWLIGGILLGFVIPFTLLVIFPTNQQLLDPTLDTSSDHARELLLRWGRLHAVRSALSVIALVLFLLNV